MLSLSPEAGGVIEKILMLSLELLQGIDVLARRWEQADGSIGRILHRSSSLSSEAIEIGRRRRLDPFRQLMMTSDGR
jgi:hypothetical protein